MKKQKLIRDNNGRGTGIKIPPGYKSLKIIRFEASGDFSFERALGRIDLRTNLENKAIPIRLDEALCKVENGSLIYVLNQNVPISKETTFIFRHMETGGFEGTLTMHYELLEIPEIPLSNPEEEFQTHLDNYDNAKIVFSAPFGSGKSYFLDYFFSKRELEYEVFKVYPVNYSVASNEDIFKYIKADLLFQLMGKDVAFDKVKFSNKEHWESFLFFNSDKIIVDIFHKLSHLDSSATIISKTVLAFEQLAKRVEEFKSEHQQDDFGLARKYLETVFEKEGSLFEDNFYTQMIRQLLERLKESHSKKSVLVIEDLDRMDPDHIFRILNVISAHYDTFKYGISEEEENSHNKFGFDKIIVVCDVKNIKAIFEHRYGKNADFAGYFNKFFSSTVFGFNNTDYWKILLRKEIANKINPGFYARQQQDTLEVLMFSLIEGGQLSLREYKQFLASSFHHFSFEYNYENNFISKGYFTKVLFYLIDYLGFEELKKRINSLKSNKINLVTNYSWYSLHLLISLTELPNREEKNGPVSIVFRNEIYLIDFYEDEFLERPQPVSTENVLKIENFKQDEFYDLLLMNMDKIRQLKLNKK
jgi:hypothetical protein